MGLRINRPAKPRAPLRPESVTLQSACHDHLNLIGSDHREVLTVKVSDFANEQGNLTHDSVKRVFDHIWKALGSDKRSNVQLELSNIRGVDSTFRTELIYLSRQLRRQRRSVRLSKVGVEGAWNDWL
ncbi:MAG: hypothetical protein KDB27_23120 [Planctomycetales bacterium]|nr:hypothetical protein [Planctomycetales bacterium]